MKLNYKIIKEQESYVNDFCLEETIYKIRINRAYGFYNIYLMLKEDDSRTLRLLFVGNARETNAFLTALQMNHWYMSNPF